MGMLSVIKAAPRIVVKTIHKTGFILKKAKPQLLVGGGIVIATGAFVLAIVNARKIDATITSSSEKVEQLEQKKTDIANAVNVSEEEKNKQIREIDKEINKAKADSIMQMFGLIGVPTLAFIGGMAMIVGGHRILLVRFGQVSSAFAALKESFDRYRKNVIADQGVAADQKYRYGIVERLPGTETVVGEDGKEKTVKTLVPVVDPRQGGSLYSFVFSEEFSRKCQKDVVNNISFLKYQEKYWNNWMQTTGKPVTLAMVLDSIGIELDPDDPMNDYILVAGWRPNGDGDNHIDFGIMRAINKPALDLEENVIMLDFNCDGNIYHSARYDKDGRKIC